MRLVRRVPVRVLRVFLAALLAAAVSSRRLPAQSSTTSTSSAVHGPRPAARPGQEADPGSVASGLYRNKTLGFACKIPEGWVLRTDEMNTRDEEGENRNQPATGAKTDNPSQPPAAAKTSDRPTPAPSVGARVLLAAFSRPPEAYGEEVNASIVIAAEPASNYPGLKEAVQYFGPLTEVAQAEGFTADEDPYEIAIGAKTLVRSDFHKDVGTRVMRQSTLVMLFHGYAVSFTVIGGTEDQVEELIDGLDFPAPARAGPAKK